MLGLKLNHVNKRVPRSPGNQGGWAGVNWIDIKESVLSSYGRVVASFYTMANDKTLHPNGLFSTKQSLTWTGDNVHVTYSLYVINAIK